MFDRTDLLSYHMIQDRFALCVEERILHNPLNQNFRKFQSKTEWIGSVQTEKFQKAGPPFDVDHFFRLDQCDRN